MHPHHRTCVLVVVVGLVVAFCYFTTSGWAVQPPAREALRPSTRPSEAPRLTVPVSGAATEDMVAQGVQDAETRQALVDALTAQQAQDLADQLQAAADRLAQAALPKTPSPSVAVTPAAPAPSDCYGVNTYAAFIYQHESGCRTEAVNGGGCAGIGQACPGSKMPCSLSDAPCQLAYFEDYALGRYGSWEAAYGFWQGHGWW